MVEEQGDFELPLLGEGQQHEVRGPRELAERSGRVSGSPTFSNFCRE